MTLFHHLYSPFPHRFWAGPYNLLWPMGCWQRLNEPWFTRAMSSWQLVILQELADNKPRGKGGPGGCFDELPADGSPVSNLSSHCVGSAESSQPTQL